MMMFWKLKQFDMEQRLENAAGWLLEYVQFGYWNTFCSPFKRPFKGKGGRLAQLLEVVL